VKAAVLGTTGYTGLLLARLLAEHPEVTELLPVSSSRAGERFVEVDPGFRDRSGKVPGQGRLLSLEEAREHEPQVVFSALPHVESARLCALFLDSAVVIDLSADFRLRNAAEFAAAYGVPHPHPELLERAVYGLAEWNTDAIRASDLIANPGCYPTATLLPLLPLLAEGLVRGEIHVSAMSGISGAGRKVKLEYLFCERAENLCAYSPGRSHRHVSEIEGQLKALDPEAHLIFVPHLVPLRKGMAVTTTVRLSRAVSEAQIGELLERIYAGRPCIGLRGTGVPQTRDVRGTNRCDIGFRMEGQTLILFSVLDNLMKGASGQAVQNMNLRFGFPETTGLALASEI
jgi:N-acetyl-gamma-glutamyl-phosphate reductase